MELTTGQMAGSCPATVLVEENLSHVFLLACVS